MQRPAGFFQTQVMISCRVCFSVFTLMRFEFGLLKTHKKLKIELTYHLRFHDVPGDFYTTPEGFVVEKVFGEFPELRHRKDFRCICYGVVKVEGFILISKTNQCDSFFCNVAAFYVRFRGLCHKSTHPQPLPARREGSLLLRQTTVYVVITYISAAPLPFQGRGWGWVVSKRNCFSGISGTLKVS